VVRLIVCPPFFPESSDPSRIESKSDYKGKRSYEEDSEDDTVKFTREIVSTLQPPQEPAYRYAKTGWIEDSSVIVATPLQESRVRCLVM
jgi:hypothetical protein